MAGQPLFGQKYTLTVGRSVKNTTLIQGNSPDPQSLFHAVYKTKTVSKEKSIQFDDVYIEANINYKKTKSASQQASHVIKLFNLNTIDESFIKQGDTIMLAAGYDQDGELPRIFSGKVISKSVVDIKPNRIVTLQVGQYFDALRDVEISRSWSPKVPYKISMYEVLKDIIKDIKDAGVDFGSSQVIEENLNYLSNINFPTGWVATGNAFDILDKLLGTMDWSSYLSNEVLYLEPRWGVKTSPVFHLYEENFKAPVQVKLDNTKKAQGVGGATGFIFTLFLDGRATLNKKVRLLEGEYKGVYRITAVKHTMAYEKSAWTTEVLCEREGVGNSAPV